MTIVLAGKTYFWGTGGEGLRDRSSRPTTYQHKQNIFIIKCVCVIEEQVIEVHSGLKIKYYSKIE